MIKLRASRDGIFGASVLKARACVTLYPPGIGRTLYCTHPARTSAEIDEHGSFDYAGADWVAQPVSGKWWIK